MERDGFRMKWAELRTIKANREEIHCSWNTTSTYFSFKSDQTFDVSSVTLLNINVTITSKTLGEKKQAMILSDWIKMKTKCLLFHIGTDRLIENATQFSWMNDKNNTEKEEIWSSHSNLQTSQEMVHVKHAVLIIPQFKTRVCGFSRGAQKCYNQLTLQEWAITPTLTMNTDLCRMFSLTLNVPVQLLFLRPTDACIYRSGAGVNMLWFATWVFNFLSH